MLIQTTKLPDWDSTHANALREFLDSDVGKRVIAHVTADKPSLLDGSDVNKTLVASGAVAGFTLAIESLFRLIYEQPEPEKIRADYPSLDDEKAWENEGGATTNTNLP